MTPLPPNSTIGIVGGGQLGRMLASAAGRLGYRTIVLEPAADAPSAQFANRHIVAAYDDEAALADLSAASDVVTYEFENVPLIAAAYLEKTSLLFPSARALEVAQDRLVEKTTLQNMGVPVAPFRAVENVDGLQAALSAFNGGVLKTRRFGYDGKGQHVFRSGDEDTAATLSATGTGPWILEKLMDFEREVSVICARGQDGALVCFDCAENVHENGILRRSVVPATGVDEPVLRAMARTIAEGLDYVGVLSVEFFITADGPVVNEIAPRVHNSGHWTREACAVSQFEQHIRAIVGLPLGNTARHRDCVMDNLLGDEISQVAGRMARGDVVTLYGKADARPGRKMGHSVRLV